MKKKNVLFWIVLVLVLFLGFNSAYSLKENEYGIRLQFNKIVAIDESSGLYFKIPFIQNVRKVPKSIQLYDIRPSDVMTSDKKSMIADMYILWRIVDPTVYYQTLNANVNNAKDRTGITVYNSVKSVISSMTQDEIIEARGEKLTQTITADANPDIKKYG
ncbi:SPFH domain/Band 7 family protein, partial [Fusobacterium sp. CM21]